MTLTPKTLTEALDLRNQQPLIPFAGGTDLMVRRRNWSGTRPGFEHPALFIGELKELKAITVQDGVLTIGAAVPLVEILEHPDVPEILKQAIRVMASPAIRNMATLGGNICNASPAADTLPPLTVLGAILLLQNSTGRREIAITEFIKGPGQNVLKSNELLTAIHIPLADYNHCYYKKVGTRKADALSKVSFAGLAGTAGGFVTKVKIAIGAVAPRVVHSEKAEEFLQGKPVGDLLKLWPEIKEFYAEYIRPINDQRSTAVYRNEVAFRLIEDFITQLK